MKLSIIIPVYNESKTILKILDKIKKVKIPIKKEIIIVDDFSKDGTRKILKKIKDKNIKIYFHNKNLGKGSTIKTGINNSGGDLIIIQDADLEYDPSDYKKLIKPILDGKTKVVYGSRFLKNNKKIYNIYYFGNKILSFLTSIIYLTKITDMETCYKVFDSKLIKKMNIKSKRFDFEPEITSKLLKNNIKILEVPISYFPRRKSEGKKIRIKDGVIALLTLIKYRFAD